MVEAHLNKSKTKYGKGRVGDTYISMKSIGESTWELFGARMYLPSTAPFESYAIVDTASDLFAVQGWECAEEASCEPDYEAWNIYPAA